MLTKKIKRLIKLGLLLGISSFSLLFIFHLLIQRPSVQDFLLKRLSDVSDFTIQTERIELSLWRIVGIRVQGLEARSKQGTSGLRAANMRMVLHYRDLLRGQVVPARIHLDRPVFDLEHDPGAFVSGGDQEEDPKGLPHFWIPGLEFISVAQGRVNFRNETYFLENISGNARLEKSGSTIRARLRFRGDACIEEEQASFDIAGEVSYHPENSALPRVHLDLDGKNIPLRWFPWPDSLPVKEGECQAQLIIEGDLDKRLPVRGRIIVDSPRFLLQGNTRTKEYNIPRVIVDFASQIDRHEIIVPSLEVKTEKAAFSMSMALNFQHQDGPHLTMEVKSNDMSLETVKDLFPGPLLPPWFDFRLLPILCSGKVRLEELSLKGTSTQFRDLARPENRTALRLKIGCEDFKVFGMGMGRPFENVSAKVGYDAGDFKISNLEASFGQSRLKGSELNVIGITDESPVYEALVDGSFDLQELMQQKEIAIIPSNITQPLDRLGPVSGRLECLAGFRYENEWPLPRAGRGDFVFSDVRVHPGFMPLPLSLNRAEIRMSRKGETSFSAGGSWGNSVFHATGVLGDPALGYPIQRADVIGEIDMNEILPLWYPGDPIALSFNSRLPCEATLQRQEDRWSCRGKAGLDGVAFETVDLVIAPPARGGEISFDMDFSPGGRINLHRINLGFGPSSMTLSGSYGLESRTLSPLKITASAVDLKDFGLKAAPTATAVTGLLTCDLSVDIENNDPSALRMTGQMRGENISLAFNRFPSTVNQCSFTCQFLGDKVVIPHCNLKVGESRLSIEGEFVGWDGLQGAVTLSSDYVDASDFLSGDKFPLSSNDTSDGSRFWDKSNFHLRADVLKGKWKRLTCGPFEADADIRGKDIFIKRSALDLEHGRVEAFGYLKRRGEAKLFLTGDIQLQEQPLQELFEALVISEKPFEGDLTMKAFLSVRGNDKNQLISSLTGDADVLIEKGLIYKSNVFIKILDFLSLQKIFKKRPPELCREGFYFERMRGDLVIDKGLVTTGDMIMESPVLNAVASGGKVDLADKKIDFILGIRPLETLDTVVSSIPIVGHIVTGEEKSFLTYNFKTQGPWADPSVEYLPFNSLGKGVPGIMKRLFLTPVRLLKGLSKAVNDAVKNESPLSDGDKH
ncbi:MAG: AsmA-like C-terminal domain-containing protein [Desulfatiglandales bacterium]